MTFQQCQVDPVTGLETPEFILRPIAVADAELDYEAVMESRDFLRIWENSAWPEDDFSVEANRKDMVKLERRHSSGESFAYTMMNPARTECLGCVYVFSPDASWLVGAQVAAVSEQQWSDCDAMLYFWVRKSRLDEGLDRTLLDALLVWFDEEWSFEALVVVTAEPFDQQVAMIEGSGLRRRFEIALPDEIGRQVAYS